MTSIAIIGAGMIGNVHAESASRIGTNIVAVFDPNETKGNIFADKFSCVCESSIDSLLNRSDIDGIVVAVPNYQHAPIAIQALELGKNVLLEKPMALSIGECDRILEARDRSGKVLQLGFVCRYSPSVIRAKEMIDSGMIGKVLSVQSSLLRQRGIPGLGGWFTTKELSGGGCLIDIGVHLIDLMMHITSINKPRRVIGRCSQSFDMKNYSYDEMWSDPVENGTFNVEDRVKASISFDRGVVFDLNVSWATHIPEKTIFDGLIIEGVEGSLIVDLWSDKFTHAYSLNGRPHSDIISVNLTDAWNDAFDNEHRAFAQSIENNSLAPRAGTGEDGKCVQEIVEAIYRSNFEQKEMAIN